MKIHYKEGNDVQHCRFPGRVVQRSGDHADPRLAWDTIPWVMYGSGRQVRGRTQVEVS